MIHLVFTCAFRPLLFLLLGGHLLLHNVPHSTLAIRLPAERRSFDWEDLIDQETAAEKRLTALHERARARERELDFLTALDRNTREPRVGNAPIDSLSPLNENGMVNEPRATETVTARAARLKSDASLDSFERTKRRNDTLFLMIVGSCSVIGTVGLIAAAVFWFNIQKRAEAATDHDYPSYGMSGMNPNGSKLSSGSAISDRKLAHSAQMFHYQQQRQQMMAQEKAHLDTKPLHSEESDEDAPGVGDYTVYECPGLAPTGEMEVRNPLFAEPESSSISPASMPYNTTTGHHLATSTPITTPSTEKSSS